MGQRLRVCLIKKKLKMIKNNTNFIRRFKKR